MSETKHTPGPLEISEFQETEDAMGWEIWVERPATDSCKANPRIALCEEMGGNHAGAEGREE